MPSTALSSLTEEYADEGRPAPKKRQTITGQTGKLPELKQTEPTNEKQDAKRDDK